MTTELPLKGKILLFTSCGPAPSLAEMEGRMTHAENEVANLRKINIDLRLQLDKQAAMLRSFMLGNTLLL